MDQEQNESGAGTGPELLQSLSPARVDAWILRAQPGARLIYHSGLFAGEAGPRLIDKLQAEAARGMIYLVQQRRRGFEARRIAGFDYIAVRSSRPGGPRASAAPYVSPLDRLQKQLQEDAFPPRARPFALERAL